MSMSLRSRRKHKPGAQAPGTMDRINDRARDSGRKLPPVSRAENTFRFCVVGLTPRALCLHLLRRLRRTYGQFGKAEDTGVRFERRRRAGCSSSAGLHPLTILLLLLLLSGHLQVWHIYITTAFQAVLNTFQWLALSAAVTLVAPPKHLGRTAGMPV